MQDQDARRRARLLAGTCLVAVASGLAAVALSPLAGGGDLERRLAATSLAAVVLAAVAYALARSRWPRAGAILFIVESNVTVWLLIRLADHALFAHFLYPFLAIPLGAAALLESLPVTLTVVGANLAVAPFAEAATHDRATLFLSLVAMSILGAMVVLLNVLRTRDAGAMRESEARFRLLADAAREGVLVHEEGRIVAANAAASALFGYAPGDLAGRSIVELVDTSSWPEVARRVRENQPGTYQVTALRKDGSRVQIEVTAAPVPLHRRRARVVTLRDLTAQRQFEADARRASLEAQMGAQARADLLGALSHELRTPLHAILAQVDLLHGAPLTPAQHDGLEVLQRSTAHLVRLLGDALDYVDSEQGQLQIEVRDVDLGAVLRDVADEHEPAAAERGLRLLALAPDGVPRVRSDPDRVRRVLDALVSNAVRFTAQGSVTVRLEATVQDGRIAAAFTVQDTGPGVAPAVLARLFEPFIQGDQSATRRNSGLGLSLALAKRIAHALGGDLQGTSTPQGATFTFRLDAAQAAPAAAADADLPTAALRVLVAEDNAVNQVVLLRMLERLGQVADVVADGQAALDALAGKPYDLVLMDLHMPILGGLEATRRLRARGERAHIVAVTADTTSGSHDACRAAGMDGYLVKPLRLDALRAALLEAARRRTAA